MKRKTNFERYLEDQLKDKAFADRFRKAGHPSLLCCFGSGRGGDKGLTSAESWVS